MEFFCISWYAGRAYAAIAVLEVACGLLGSPVTQVPHDDDDDGGGGGQY